MFSKEDESSLYSKNLFKPKKENPIMNSVFELYFQLYHEKKAEEKSFLRQIVAELIESGIWTCQIASLLWIPHLSILNWNENRKFWEFIGYLRLDNICAELGLLNTFFYLSITITLMLFVGISVLVFITYNSYNSRRLFFGIFKWIFKLWTIAMAIPSMVVFSIFLKYNILSQKYISKYKYNYGPRDFEISIAVQILIVIAMIINFCLILFHTEFSGEIRHSINQKNIKARAHSKIDAHRAIFAYFSAIICVLFDENSIIYFQLIEIIISTFIIIEIIVLLPYFSYYCNIVLILQFFTVAFTSFVFTLGYWLDNSLFIILITIFLWPLSVLLVIQFTWIFQKKIISKIPIDLAGIKSKYQLEKSLRHSLCINDIENKNQIIYLFETFFIENISLRDKLQAIWIANYCLFTLKDESLAKVKLCKSKKNSEWKLETNFQEYLCSINISWSNLSESTQFVEYFQQLILIKKKDFKLCANLLRFWEEMTAYRPNLKMLTQSLGWLDKNIEFLDNQYTKLAAKFVYSKEFLKLHASFSKDILFDLEKSNFLENKLNAINLNIMSSLSKSYSCFDDSNGILIISAEGDSFGSILFSNHAAKIILKFSLIANDDWNIMDFFPSYCRESIKIELNNILHFSSSGEIDLTEGIFFNLPTNFIIECIGKVVITSINNLFVFILVFKQRETKNQVAMISENGEICGHSENFPEAVKMNSENLTGFNIKKLFSEKEFDLHWSVPYYLQNCEKETILIFSFFHLKGFYVLLMNDSEEIEKWKKN